MKKLLVLIGALALLAAGTTVALANNGADEPLLAAQTEDGDTTEPEPDPSNRPLTRGSFLGEVLDELVDEGVITEAQAAAIEERLAERHEERHEQFDADGTHRFGFRFPGRGFGRDLPQRIEIPEEALDQLRGLMESLGDELELPFGRRFFHLPGDSLRDFLDDGELSAGELEQLEAELRQLAERMRDRFEDRWEGRSGTDADGASFDA